MKGNMLFSSMIVHSIDLKKLIEVFFFMALFTSYYNTVYIFNTRQLIKSVAQTMSIKTKLCNTVVLPCPQNDDICVSLKAFSKSDNKNYILHL